MYLSILHIRLKQAYRAGSGMGLFRTIFVIGLVVFMLLALYTYLLKPEWSKWIAGAYLTSILIIHIRRTDKEFLKVNITNYQRILVFEYLLLALPLLACLAYARFFELAIYSLAGILAIPFINLSFQKRTLNNRIIGAIPDEAFEWKSGMRKYFILILFTWLAGLLASGYVGSIPVAIVVLSLLTFNFFETGEPLSFLESAGLNPQGFLLRKIIVGQTIISFILLPLVVVFILFHTELWYIPVIEFLLVSTILWYSILLKYAFYKPNKQLVAGQVFTAIGGMSLFLPFLIPLIWILSIRFYLQSIANLKPYLDDFN